MSPRPHRVTSILAFVLAALGLAGPTLAAAQTGTNSDSDDNPETQKIVVTGVRDIVVNGRARHCYRLRHDPIDSVDATPSDTRRPQMEIAPVGDGKLAFEPDEERLTGPAFWQRAGTGIDQYIFRTPTTGSPLCIGAKMPDPDGFGQLRRIVDAAPYRGKRVRFTAWATTGGARLVRFWLAAGKGMRKLTNGGNTNNRPWGGNHGWTPILLEIGPISPEADHISYGFLLWGGGDVWVYDPKLEIVTDEPPEMRTGEFVIIGRDKH